MKRFIFSALAASLILIAGCDKNKEEEVKNLTPDEAKVELRDAAQQINTDMTEMMEMPAFTSGSFLMDLMGEESLKSTVRQLVFGTKALHLHAVKAAFAPANGLKSDVADYGVYAFNFATEAFDLVEPSTTMLKISYPADEVAYAAQQNNAEMLAENLQYQTIVYTETYWDEWTQTWVTETYDDYVPSSANVTQKIDGAVVLTASYSGTYTEEGNPVAVNASVTAAPVSFTMSMAGTGVNYQTALMFKENNTEMMGFDMDVVYSSDMSDVEKLTGYYLVAPLKVEGWMNPAAIDNHISEIEENGGNYDLAFLNTQLSLELFQAAENAKIGDLQYKLYTDTEYNETYPMIAVVYSDGTYEWLEDIMGNETLKLSRKR